MSETSSNYNQALVQELRNKYEQFKLHTPTEDIIRFNKDGITIDSHGLFIDGVQVVDKSKTKFLARMKVKENFTDVADHTTDADWETITNILKQELPDTFFYAKLRRTDEQEEIFAIIDFPTSDKSTLLDKDVVFESILSELGKSSNPYKLFNFTYDHKNNNLILGLVDEGTRFDVFSNDNDKWHGGIQFKLSSTTFTTRHLLERTICANGMTTKENCYQRHINNKNFNIEAVDKAIVHAFSTDNEDVYKKVIHQAEFLNQNEVSIAEFYKFTKPALRLAKKCDMLDEVEAIFSDDNFFAAYSTDIKKQSDKWKGSATTGINAYKFFNALTYVATHKFGEDYPNEATELQLNASNFFFKETMDLNEVAPVMDVPFANTHIAYR